MRRRDFLKLFSALAAAPFVPLAAKLIAEGSTGDQALDEAVMRQALEKCWSEGESPEWIIPSDATTVVDSVRIYASDFGQMSIMDPRFQRAQEQYTKLMSDRVDRLFKQSAITPLTRGMLRG